MSQANDLHAPELWRALLSNIPAAVFVHDGKGRFVEVNDTACESVGYSHAQLLQMNVLDIEQEHHLELDERLSRLEVGETWDLHGVHKHANGTTNPVEIQVRPFISGDNRLYCAIVRPARMPAESVDELAHAQKLERDVFRSIFEKANEPIAIIDHEGRYLVQNDAHRRLLGYTDEELNDKTPAIHLGPAAFQEVGKALASDGEIRGQFESRTKSGDKRIIDLAAFAIEREDGKPPLFVGIKRDVTDLDRERREQASRELTELEEGLRQAQKMQVVGQLAAGIAHDMNNLLTPVLAYADCEALTPGLPDSTREALAEILSAAQRGRDLTRRLLAFGRKQKLTLQPLDLGRRVDSSLTMLRRIVPAEIEFDVQTSESLPNVMADATAVEQVLMNLVSNAADAMADGGKLRIAVEAIAVTDDDHLARVLGTSGTFVQLTVADTGVGMTASELERIFEPFYTQKPTGRGTGLGLSIVHGIVRQHAGVVTVDSTHGLGTTFRVVLPPTEHHAAGAQPIARTAPGSTAATILVVEDDETVRHLVERLLQDLGYRTLLASESTEAIRLAEQHGNRIDLLLTDVVMPGLNGPELHARLCESLPNLPVLYMSGYPRDGLTPAGKISGSMQIIEKPFTKDEMRERLAAELGAAARSD